MTSKEKMAVDKEMVMVILMTVFRVTEMVQ